MKDFLRDLAREGLTAVLPITLTVVALHFTFIPLGADLPKFLAGAVFVGGGIALFLAGVRIGLVPLGEFIGSTLGARGNLFLILAAGFIFGVIVTAADPDARVLAHMVASVDPSISSGTIIFAVSIGLGALVVISLMRVFLQIPLFWLLPALYGLAFALTPLVPASLVPVAFDAGGITTGPVVVPFIMALCVGIVSVLSTRDRLADSFGLVAVSVLGPVLALLVLAIAR